MNGQRASTLWWVHLFEAWEWDQLFTWALMTDDRVSVLAFWDHLNAEITKETRINGAEQWASHAHPSRVPGARRHPQRKRLISRSRQVSLTQAVGHLWSLSLDV
jgi:hypothetical protein